MTTDRPIRVLHLVDIFSTGGIESWLSHIFGRMSPGCFRMDVAAVTHVASVFDSDLEKAGVRLFMCGGQPMDRDRYVRDLGRVLKENGPYDIVHCHWLFDKAIGLRVAKERGVPVRIAGSHMAAERIGPVRALRLRVRHWRMRRVWTNGIACSENAGDALYGPGWQADPRLRLLYCGVDLAPFDKLLDETGTERAAVRAELGIPPDAFVIGHVGRFDPQKNHAFLLDIAARAVRDPRVYFLLVGGGRLFEEVRNRVAAEGLMDRVVLAGVRRDVPRLAVHAMDAFVMPSLFEGLPLVGMEAQAAGLPTLVSDRITAEMDVVPGLVRRMSLSEPAESWAEALLSMRREDRSLTREEALAYVERSPFNICNSVRELECYYLQCLKQAGR